MLTTAHRAATANSGVVLQIASEARDLKGAGVAAGLKQLADLIGGGI